MKKVFGHLRRGFRWTFLWLLKMPLFWQIMSISLTTVIILAIGTFLTFNFQMSEIFKLLIVFIPVLVVNGLFINFVLTEAFKIPLKSIEAVAKSMAVGDLSQNLGGDSCREVNIVYYELNNAIIGLKKFIARINEQSDLLYNASEQLRTTSEKNIESASQVINAIQELGKGTAEQAEHLSKASENVYDLAELIRQVTEDTDNMSKVSCDLSESAMVGQSISNNVVTQINNIYDATQDISSAVEKLSKTSDEIEKITLEIKGIARQTNLLALNAAIEAARAGEHGKGFAVVAEETRKLSDRTMKAIKNVNDFINEINSRNQEIEKVISYAVEQVSDGKQLSQNAKVKFEEIFNALRNNSNQIDAVAMAARKIGGNSININNTISGIAAFSEEIMASNEEVLAVSQEQTDYTEYVATLAQKLTETANVLKESIIVYISFSYFGNKTRIDITKKTLDTYMKKYPYVKFSVNGEVSADSKEFYSIMMSQLEQGTATDLLQINQPWLVEMYQKGYLVDLYKDKNIDLSGFNKNALDMCTVNNYLLGLPTGLNSICLIVNRNFFTKFKIPFDTVWDWDNLLEIGTKVHSQNNDCHLLLSYDEYTMHLIKMYVRQKTGKPLINDDYSLGFGIDDMANAFNYFKRLKDNGVLISANELSQTTNSQNADEIMLKEITGMICCWVSDFDKTKNQRFKGCDVSIEMPPISKDAKISAIVVKPQLILAVNQKSENKREVMKLLNWIYNNPDGIKSWGVNRGPSPTVIGSRVQQEENMVHEEISRGIKLAMDRGGSHENSLSNHVELLNIFIEINGRVLLGEVTPQEAANELVEKLVKKLKLLKKKKS